MLDSFWSAILAVCFALLAASIAWFIWVMWYSYFRVDQLEIPSDLSKLTIIVSDQRYTAESVA